MDNFKRKIKLVNKSANVIPSYETEGSAGFDIRANIQVNFLGASEIVIKSGEFTLIPTGLFFDIPKYMELQIRPRSGMAAKHGVTVLNSPGTIDSDYTGEVKVILINHGKEDFVIKNGDRIAQGVFATNMGSDFIEFEAVDVIDKTTHRGEGGFGSTGSN